MALGSYPAVSLAQARLDMAAVKAVRASGLDPVQARKDEKLKAQAMQKNTLAEVATEFMTVHTHDWSLHHRMRCQRILDSDLLPQLGYKVMQDISAPELILVLRQIETRNTLSALTKAHSLCSALWGFGVSTGKANVNIASGLRVLKAQPVRHLPAITEPSTFNRLPSLAHLRVILLFNKIVDGF